MVRPHPLYALLPLLFLATCNNTDSYGAFNDIAEAKQQWESNNFTSYRVDVERICFCPPPQDYSMLVQNSEVIEVIDMETGEPVSSLGAYQSIEDIFAWLQNVASDKPMKLDLEFDPEYGYPTFIDYNQSDQIADEELLMRITNLETN